MTILGGLTIAAIILGITGGLGPLSNLFISDRIRAWNRISIFIAYFAFAAVALMFDRLDTGFMRPRGWRWGALAVAVALVAFGAWDQTSPSFRPPYEEMAARQRNVEEFVARIDAALPTGAMVYQIPYTAFPESPPVNGMQDYDHFKAYLATPKDSLRWSYGAMKARDVDLWQRALASTDTATMLGQIQSAGFAGLWVDRAGYTDNGSEVEAAVARLTGSAPIVSRDGRYAFFSLARP
jgi:phosphoglycerol transferase